MGWARFDDEYPRHQKIQRIPAELRADAMALELAALCYSARVLSDGFIAKAVTGSLALEVGFEKKSKLDQPRLARVLGALVDAERWISESSGYQIHDYSEYQPTASDVKERRKREAEKKRRQRAGGKQQALSLGLSRGDTEGDMEEVSPSLSLGDASHVGASRAHAPTRPGPSPTHEVQEQRDLALSAERSGATAANGLPVEKERLTIELLAAIGDAGDEGTPQIVRRFAARLPEGSLAKVLESVLQSKARNRARYVVGALKDELELVEPRSRSATLRRDPEAWVREVGWKMPADVFEEALVEVVPGDQERDEDARIGLRELAANLREGA